MNEDKKHQIEFLLGEGKRIIDLSGDELWRLYRECEFLGDELFKVVEQEIINRIG